MGRHGGGSRGGGSSRSGGGSRGGRGGSSSSYRSSKSAFSGSYRRSYINRRGRQVTYYTTNQNFGKSGNCGFEYMCLALIGVWVLLMLFAFIGQAYTHGEKVNGEKSRIDVHDYAEILTYEEEMELIELFEGVYDKSGMPITLFTDDFSWREHYYDIEVYSEELYYDMSYREDAMVILFTQGWDDDFYDWEYDVYCGDDTISCFSDATFDNFLDAFQQGMSANDQMLKPALEDAWGRVYDELAESSFDKGSLPILFVVAVIACGAMMPTIINIRRKKDAYNYFKENPDKLSDKKITILSQCPNCGAPNTKKKEVCEYCDSLLLLEEGNVSYVKQ